MVGYFEVESIRGKNVVTVRGNLKRGSFLSENHERRVDGDAREPSPETGPAVKVSHVNKRSQQCVLNCVFRVLTVPGDPMGSTKELLSISFGKRGEGHGMPALGGFHEAVVSQSVRAAPWRDISLR
jgi:hypothetical protein